MTRYFKISLLFALSLFWQSCKTDKPDGLIADGALLTIVADDFEFTEGPASDREGNVFFTDQPNDRILRWTAADNVVSVYMQPSGRSNGLYIDGEGNLLACADEKFELISIDSGKKVQVLLDSFNNKKLNGPNDLWIDPKGGIYFTDPYYQRPWWNRTEMEQEKQCVYYLSPDRQELKVVEENLVKPNGIIGTADGKTIYIADIGDSKTYVYTVNDDASLSNKKRFTEMGSDGMTTDEQGNVYLTNENGVTVFDQQGLQVLQIPVPQKWTANVTFGGKDHKTLFITAMNAVYTLEMNVKGVRW